MQETATVKHPLNLEGVVIGKVVDFDPASDQLYPFNFTASNTELSPEVLADTAVFSDWITGQMAKANARYGIGGYDEHRTIYARSSHFDAGEEPRRLHLGVDIWGPAGTKVYNFYKAEVHSFKFNDHYGDYGATIILKYDINGRVFYALYGHLSLSSIADLKVGQKIAKGAAFATFGIPEENGHWPPHLHFQLIFNLFSARGDYPGVCPFSQKAVFLLNSPDPSAILKHTFKAALI
ncbi:peptidoglycan DD-metalloendopeptidase family protein [Pedobacter sp. PLR]|uniref:peptidoglycan DD-metalloendopeptidase family protein n=1 Tax=Pedobacter sp. PLR TaxID=2994465 RepID=UPI00224740ED|nr:peptidoglycan DD-metalloendopeptidase family protein [Pedobacter sp. PLR]MCX2452782.1 peptidoglycan DD-metalloendopeptidase family protein [Pedobacter sp. PLR]